MNAPRTLIACLLALAGCSTAARDEATHDEVAAQPAPPIAPAMDDATRLERGRYLVTTSGCHDCHTPLAMGPDGPAPDMRRALSGHPEGLALPPPPALPDGPWLVTVAATNTAWSGPWGVSFTANLTPDRETGLGAWTEENFIATIRNGRHMGAGRPLLPPMPAPMYKHFSDADLGAIFAYLRSVPAISNRVPEPISPALAAVTPGATR